MGLPATPIYRSRDSQILNQNRLKGLNFAVSGPIWVKVGRKMLNHVEKQ